MPNRKIVRRGALFGSAIWLVAVGGLAVTLPSLAVAAPATVKAAKAKAKQHGPSRQALARLAGEYWDAVVAKRRVRIAKRRNNEPITLDDYVLTQPPAIMRRLPPRPPSEQHIPRIPVLANFLNAAAEHHGFVPDLPESEIAFKQAYAKAATAAGVTGDQAVGIYAFETGGNGAYNVQSGLTHPSRRARAISPAMARSPRRLAN